MCFDSITHTAEAEYTTAKTSVWWDIENCPVPKGWDAHKITQKLNSVLLNLSYCGPLTISAYGNTDLIPKAVQQALSSTGISLNHVPSGKKDASDKKILVDMFFWVLENPAPANLMLISGDGDFSDALHRLRMRRYNILLAHPLQASPSLIASARTSWLWRSLLASGSCSIDSEISSQDVSVSEHVVDSGSGSSNAARKKLKGILKELNHQETKRMKLQKKCSETEWLCRVCNVACKSIEVFTTGKEHAAQFELKQNLEGEPENQAAASSGSHEQDTDKVVEAGVEMKKQAEALVDAKNIEEIVQDNDLQSQDALESMKCLEKQNKELMEAITTSERSGREFWQDFKERLDKNGVAPLNVDHVFSELSCDFRVPEEVRECFEAIFKKLEPTQNDIETEKLESMLKQGLEIESGEQENAPAGPTENPEEDINKKKKSTVIEDKDEPYVCSICNVNCAHPSVYESHRKGRKHAAKLKKHIDDLLDKHQRREEIIQDMTVIEDKYEPFVCSICNVICDHHAMFESHHKGRKHSSKFNKHIDALLDKHQRGDEIIQDNSLPKDMTEELRIKPVEAPENTESLDKQRQELRETCATSERSVEEFSKTIEEVRENDYKSLPNAEFTAPQEARELIGAIFKKPGVSEDSCLTLEFESIPNENLEMNSGDPESISAGATEHPEEYIDIQKDKVTKDKAELKAYVCSICSVICLSPSVFESHLMGRKHAKRVKNHAEVHFDDKKVLEQSEEKDHTRDAFEELQFEPKDAQVSIKEVSQITKARVDSKENESVEFPEDKETSRERFDSMVKRLELFMEKTSKETVVGTGKENGVATAQIRVCEWCNVICNNQMDFDTHMAGKRHVAKTQTRVCGWCSVMCHSQEEFDLHLGGKRHAAMLRKSVPLVKEASCRGVEARVESKLAYVRKNGPLSSQYPL